MHFVHLQKNNVQQIKLLRVFSKCLASKLNHILKKKRAKSPLFYYFSPSGFSVLGGSGFGFSCTLASRIFFTSSLSLPFR